MTYYRRLPAAALVASGIGIILVGCGSIGPSAPPASPGAAISSSPSGVAPSPTGTPVSAPVVLAGCAISGLTAALGPGSVAAGSTFYPIVFTNTSASACTLYGYPGVSFVTVTGSQVGAAATESPAFPRQLVTLAPGKTAHAELKISSAQNYPSSRCSPIRVDRLKVYPPGQTVALYVSLSSTGCAATAIPLLVVQTVRPGSSG